MSYQRSSFHRRPKWDSQKRILNAYEHAIKANDKAETNGHSSEQESEEEEEEEGKYGDTVIDARALLKGEEVEGIDDNDFEDEELDSDEAFGSSDQSDEEDLNHKKFGDDLDDDFNLKYDGIDPTQLMPLSAIWDLDEKEVTKDKVQKVVERRKKNNNSDIILDDNLSDSDEDEEGGYNETSSSENGDDDDEDEDPFDEIDEEDVEEEEGAGKLTNVMTALKKGLPKEKKEVTSLVNDNMQENSYSLPTQGKELSFADMMVGVDNMSKDQQPALLLKDRGEDVKNNKGFAVPLPQSIQKRQERKAAYEIQKEEVAKWEDTIESNRQAEVLKFGRDKIEHSVRSSFEPTERPLNEIEEKIDAVLETSNVESKKTEDMFEQIETAKMTKNDIFKRTKELRLMRELMYRGQRDSKRLKKIKSKAYRRILRKEKMKNQRLVEEAEGESGEDVEEAAYERAKERMTLKHKNTSAWAKNMIKSGMSKDADTREEMEEMLRKGESLKKKQLGKKDVESSDEDDEREISDIEKEVGIEGTDNASKEKLGKGVLAMDFMRNADKKERERTLEEISELRNLEEGGDDSDEKQLLRQLENSVNINSNSGRRVYTPSAALAAEGINEQRKEILREVEEDNSRDLEHRLKMKGRKHKKISRKEDDEEVNPWLEDTEEKTRKSSKVHVTDGQSSRLEKSAAKIAKKAKKAKKRSRRDSENEEDVVIEDKQTLNIGGGLEDEFEGEGDKEEDIRVFKQKDLIREAFAGDDVIEKEFENEKKEIEELEGDKEEVEEELPGWGSWCGGDESENKKRKKNKKRRIFRTVQGVVPKDRRLDKGKKNVIVNERVNKKNVRYLADKVPYPFKTWAQYEKTLRTPIGQDWNSRDSFQKMTMPKVLSKYGDVIDPMKAPFN
ncbi:hypothetical protein FOA43_002577 [Brettanomyces nanus]|uniref:U3 small nucleolar RNA-associated protein 14 n=1 Tax=Eeniella nana TaxID=13502 RepID=A0A875RV44_EENNA|nr:uncharacterized protein FOA43_002577 [Brettanomyces nanus]QPG75227.1 hypothetical protein FOA43_002577 [Brettanomyces nanus]